MCRIKPKVWATDASGAINLKNYKKWLNAIESEPKSTRSRNVAVALSPTLDIAKKVTSTRWAFKVKPDRSLKTRQVVHGWRQKHRIDHGTTFICRFNLLVIASAKTVNIPDVQTILLGTTFREIKNKHFFKERGLLGFRGGVPRRGSNCAGENCLPKQLIQSDYSYLW